MSRLRQKLARVERLAEGRKRTAVPAQSADLESLRSQLDAVLRPHEVTAAAAPETAASGGQGESVAAAATFEKMFHDRQGIHAGCWLRLPRRVDPRLVPPPAATEDGNARWLAIVGRQPGWERCAPRRTLFLDTETTGLGGGTGCYAFLVGMAWFDDQAGHWQMEQLFLADPDDEPALLQRVKQRLEAASAIVSYNGKSFDLPLLRARFAMNRMAWPQELPHLDLLHTARRIHRHRHFRKNLVTVEREVLNFERGHDIGGADVAASYLSYLRSGSCSRLDQVLLHNHHDVVSLVALLRHYSRNAEEHPLREVCAMAEVCWQSGERVRARELADWAVAGSQGDGEVRALALALRARFAKLMGERELALHDFETLHSLVKEGRLGSSWASSEGAHSSAARRAASLPRQLQRTAVQLELAKLYEHFRREPSRALRYVESGTGEKGDAVERRRTRLLRKIARQSQAAGSKSSPADELVSARVPPT